MTYYTPGGDNNPGGHGYLLVLVFIITVLFFAGCIIGGAMPQARAFKTVMGM